MEYRTDKIKLMIVDDHSLLREGFISMFKYNPEFEVIADAPNGLKAINILHKIQPDILLLDIDMPLMNGKETLEYVMKFYPSIKVVMLSMYSGHFYEKEYKSLGACSFITKGIGRNEFLKILKEVSKGEYNYTQINTDSIIPKKNDRYLQLSLSNRERDIVGFVCSNLSYEQISEKLDITVNTVKYYRKEIARKTQTSTIADLVKYAIRNGLITTD